MRFLYVEKQDRNGAYAEITGFEGERSFLNVPEELGGLVVRKIGKNAFSGRRGLTGVRLPATVTELGDFAFYGCQDLKQLFLTDRTEEIGDGAVRNCPQLSAEILTDREKFTGLKGMLADTDLPMRVTLRFPDGECRLYFPGYVADFDEDTMARALHPRIEGSGTAFREAVSRGKIDFFGFDMQFHRAEDDGLQVAAEVAFGRLLFPYRLTETAAEAYRKYLERHGDALLPDIIKSGETDRLRYLAEGKMITGAGTAEALKLASELKKTELCGILMEFGRKSGPEASAEAETFSLDDL